MKKKYTGMSSAAIHASGHDNADHAHLTPIYANSTFTFDTATERTLPFVPSLVGYLPYS